MTAVIETLKGEHETFSKILSVLEDQVGIFERGGDPDYELIRMIIDYFMVLPDEAHHPTEDKIYQRLFDRDGTTAALLGDLEIEHAHLRELLVRIEQTLRNVLTDLEMPRATFIEAIMGFIEFFRSHMLMEAGRFFPAAERGLDDDDWSDIALEATRLNDALEGSEAGSTYRNLADEILQGDRALV